jgi:putative SbcD/Mre11-related phosphoesterase
VRVHGDWLLTPERAAIHLPTATAVLADVHLGYDGARRRRGDAVPAVDLEACLAPLHALVLRHDIRRLAIAGDLFEDGPHPKLVDELLAWLKQAKIDRLVVVPGNHDRGLHSGHPSLEVLRNGLTLGPWRVVHGDGRLGRDKLVHGHWHPCLRWGDAIVAPCFLVGPDRIVLPAYSPDAAGANVLAAKRWRPYRCAVIAGTDVLDFGPLADLPRGPAARSRRGRR